MSFLDIPRTYYGLLERRLLEEGGTREGELLGACAHGLAPEQADEVIAALVRAGLSDAAGAVDLDADDAGVDAALRAHSQELDGEFENLLKQCTQTNSSTFTHRHNQTQ